MALFFLCQSFWLAFDGKHVEMCSFTGIFRNRPDELAQRIVLLVCERSWVDNPESANLLNFLAFTSFLMFLQSL
jgi:hypothetical protein